MITYGFNGRGSISSVKTRVEFLENIDAWFGLEWNQTEDTYIRLGGASGRSVDNASSPHASNFNNVYPWAGMRRCNLADDGTINAYYGDAGYAEDGSNGQVMVEVPKFYCKVTYDTTTDNIWRWYVSPFKLTGYTVHPAFVDDGVEKDYIYVSAYEATAYDDSATAYAGDGITFDYANDKLASVAGLQPLSGNTSHFDIGEARQMAQNRGPGWGLLDWTSLAAVQMLYLVEYGDMYSQSVLSTGITSLDGGTGNHSQNTGHTSTLGNGSGDVTIASASLENGATGGDTYPMSYRGIENFYGNIYKFVDGILLTDSGYLIGGSIDDYNDAGTGYSLVSAPPITFDGYSSNFEALPGMISSFMPNEVSGSSSTHTTDYFYAHDTGETNIALFGRDWSGGAYSGAFSLACDSGASVSYRSIGARVLYK